MKKDAKIEEEYEWEEVKSEAFDFKEGETIKGVFLDIQPSPMFDDSWLVQLQLLEGKKIVGIWANNMLKDKLNLTSVGDVISITYLGEKESKTKGRKYKDYVVARGRRK